jgi:hypothetical protein
MGDAVDLEYFRNKMFGSMGQPKEYHGFDSVGGESARPPSRTDVRAARKVKKLQRANIQGFTRLCQIHLVYRWGLLTEEQKAKGQSRPDFDVYDPKNEFTVYMVDSAVIEFLNSLDAEQQLLDIAERMADFGDRFQFKRWEWVTHILRNVMGYTDGDIRRFLPPKAEFEKTAQEPPEGEGPPDRGGGPPKGPQDQQGGDSGQQGPGQSQTLVPEEPKEPSPTTHTAKESQSPRGAVQTVLERQRYHGISSLSRLAPARQDLPGGLRGEGDQ